MNRTDRRRFLTATLGLTGICVTPGTIRSALAQAYPSRPIHYLFGIRPVARATSWHVPSRRDCRAFWVSRSW